MMYLQPPLPVNTQRYHNISDLYCLLYRCVVQTFLIMYLISKKKNWGASNPTICEFIDKLFIPTINMSMHFSLF